MMARPQLSKIRVHGVEHNEQGLCQHVQVVVVRHASQLRTGGLQLPLELGTHEDVGAEFGRAAGRHRVQRSFGGQAKLVA